MEQRNGGRWLCVCTCPYFNSISKEEAKNITVEDFKKIKLDEMLTQNRQTGFHEMVEKMLRKI